MGFVSKLPEVGDKIGDYLLVARLGRGGGGTVFKAERAGQFFTVKFLHALTLSGRARREISILLRMDSARVVRFIGCDQWPKPHGGTPYIVTEFVEGPTLEAYAKANNPPARKAAHLLLETALALGEVHQHDVLHRDIKPENILIQGKDEQPILIDFGMGSYLGAPPLTGNRLPPGTHEFRAPEAYHFSRSVGGEPVYEYTRADDVWALGVTFYWLLTNSLPFGDRYDPQGGGLTARVLSMTPVAPHELNPRVPLALSRLCLRMLEKRAEDRLTRVEEVCAALRQALDEAKADPSWEVPLCEPDTSTEGSSEEEPAQEEADEPMRWARQWLKREPRRGHNPSEEVVAPVANDEPPPAIDQERALSVPAQEGAPPVAQQTRTPLPEAARPRWPVAAALGVALGLLLGSLMWKHLLPSMAGAPGQDRPIAPHTSAGPSPTPDGGFSREMALNSKSLNPDAGEGALPYMPSLPASDATAMQRKEDSRVKKEKKPAPRRDEVQHCVPVYKKVCRDALCTIALVGCTSTVPQVRPTPQPAKCPPHSLETMTQTLGIRPGFVSTYTFIRQVGHSKAQDVSVREGPIQVELAERTGKLPLDTVLTGEILFGKKRVYGRFTQARTPTGETFPVCFEFVQDGNPGVREYGSSGPDSLILWSDSTLMATYVFAVKEVKDDSSD